jgi:hypothetical protein
MDRSERIKRLVLPWDRPDTIVLDDIEVIRELNRVNDIVMANIPANAKVCFASTLLSMNSVMHRVMMNKEQLEKLYSEEDKKMNERGSQMSKTVTGSVNCGTLSTAGIGNAFYGQGIAENISKFRPIKIDKVANGFIVEIGCKKFVGTNWETVAKQLGEYWKDPVAAEKKYVK